MVEIQVDLITVTLSKGGDTEPVATLGGVMGVVMIENEKLVKEIGGKPTVASDSETPRLPFSVEVTTKEIEDSVSDDANVIMVDPSFVAPPIGVPFRNLLATDDVLCVVSEPEIPVMPSSVALVVAELEAALAEMDFSSEIVTVVKTVEVCDKMSVTNSEEVAAVNEPLIDVSRGQGSHLRAFLERRR
ncbi:hypothetical protein HG531_005344 [Fusarium graminearum]|nr:hypothetical protein HG531_005344 [Fusarium graminearum]